MKKMNLSLAGLFLLAGFTACNETGTDTSTTTNTTTTDSTNITTNTTGTTDTGSTSTATRTPFSTQDSTFVMKAAVGGMMEVEAGNIAQQNAASDRVKAFASMMVNDHSKANSELAALASGRGVTIPTALPADMQKHLDEMRKMKGKSFDSHYMGMMVKDHQKTLTDFEKQSTGGSDADLKAWAAKILPTLQMHRDSATAISKAKL